MRNIKLVLEYKGTNYAGFQRQPDQPTIQEVLEKTLCQILRDQVEIIGAGRTDAGVHAKGQVANFFTVSDTECQRLRWSANSLLPNDIVIKEAVEVNESFHARRDAESREYKYLVLNRDYPSPFWNNFSYFFSKALNVEAMQEASQILKGKHDFSSFCVAESKPKNCIRDLQKISVRKKNDLIHFDFKANAFLHNMVRAIVGTLVQIGTGELEPEQIHSILEARDRTKAGPTAPSHGLILMKVNY
jgi:tRNA pseudouridine38-40 synthase